MSWRLASFGQSSTIEFTIIDKENNSFVPYVNVSIQGTLKGTFSNELGFVQITANPTDTLLLSSIGYNSLKVAVGQITETILFEPSAVQLQEIVISTEKSGKREKPTTRIIGYHNHKKEGIYTGFRQAAVLIKNDLHRLGWITSLSFEIGHMKNLVHNHYRIRARILSINHLNQPGEDIYYSKNPILIKKNQKNLKISLDEMGVNFPKEGCFIVLEFLGHLDEQGTFIPYDNTKKGGYHFAPAFSFNHDFQESWIGGGNEWKPVTMSIMGQGFTNFNFSIEVEYE